MKLFFFKSGNRETAFVWQRHQLSFWTSRLIWNMCILIYSTLDLKAELTGLLGLFTNPRPPLSGKPKIHNVASSATHKHKHFFNEPHVLRYHNRLVYTLSGIHNMCCMIYIGNSLYVLSCFLLNCVL